MFACFFFLSLTRQMIGIQIESVRKKDKKDGTNKQWHEHTAVLQ